MGLEKEIKEVLYVLADKYGYDFSEYSPTHIKRRIVNWTGKNNINSLSDVPSIITSNEEMGSSLIHTFSIGVTEMFRDPLFYKLFREKAIPLLKTYPFFRIWHAGCSTGEEVYSMSILLKEEGLENKYRVYATDFNSTALKCAKEGIYTNDKIREYTANYVSSGGKNDFSNYYTSRYGSVIMDPSLKKNIVWANHNLVADSVFNEMHVVICRNVLIYFTRPLQERVLNLFTISLQRGGLLCLGIKETLRFTTFEKTYIPLDAEVKIYKKRSE
jgi:chemotaxis protein methyltransferase CheR